MLPFCVPGQGESAPVPAGTRPRPRSRLQQLLGDRRRCAYVSGHGLARERHAVFTTTGERPTALSVVLQGTTSLNAGVVAGQGVRCNRRTAEAPVRQERLGGSITAPQGAEPSVSARSAALGDVIAPGERRLYAVHYRDPIVLGGCPSGSTFNTTQAGTCTVALGDLPSPVDMQSTDRVESGVMASLRADFVVRRRRDRRLGARPSSSRAAEARRRPRAEHGAPDVDAAGDPLAGDGGLPRDDPSARALRALVARTLSRGSTSTTDVGLGPRPCGVPSRRRRTSLVDRAQRTARAPPLPRELRAPPRRRARVPPPRGRPRRRRAGEGRRVRSDLGDPGRLDRRRRRRALRRPIRARHPDRRADVPDRLPVLSVPRGRTRSIPRARRSGRTAAGRARGSSASVSFPFPTVARRRSSWSCRKPSRTRERRRTGALPRSRRGPARGRRRAALPGDFTRVRRPWGHAPRYGGARSPAPRRRGAPGQPRGRAGGSAAVGDARAIADLALSGNKELLAEYERRRRPPNVRSVAVTRLVHRIWSFPAWCRPNPVFFAFLAFLRSHPQVLARTVRDVSTRFLEAPRETA
jgi:hypothetical protein